LMSGVRIARPKTSVSRWTVNLVVLCALVFSGLAVAQPSAIHAPKRVLILFQRWSISEKQLPVGTAELFREPSGWERYRYFILAGALCILEAMLIVTLILSRQKRRRVERALLQEKTLSDAVISAIPGIFFLQDEAGKNLRWNKNSEVLARYPLSQVTPLQNVADEYKNAAQRAKEQVLAKGFGEVELEVLRKDGG
jgi:PAS domain-containing protein